jgi:hypothetical protein
MALMPSFKIHRIKDSAYLQFRWAPHTAGASQVKPRDYAEAGAIDASTAYAAWKLLSESGQPLRVGDVLEEAGGTLRIYKYVGFEEAQWVLPEARPAEAGPAGATEAP